MSTDTDKANSGKRETGLVDLAKIVAMAIVFALVIRTFLFQPFNIPSGSMKPTLLVGDYLFISKFSYGFSRYSFPFRFKLFSGRIFGSEPERGDVIVFDVNGTDYIKRLIGLPGDRIQVRSGILYINGVAVPREPLPSFATSDLYGMKREVTRYREILPGGRSYQVLDLIENSAGDNTREYQVPEGHYFMMGDNRDNSSDSRFNAPIGFVPRENLIGKAEFLYFSRSEVSDRPSMKEDSGHIRWDRIFSAVR